MDIKLLPAATPALTDANIFIYHLGGVSTECTQYLERVAHGELESYVTTIILAEVLHRRMVGEALGKKLVSAGQPLKKLKGNREIIPMLTDYITDVETILKLPLRIIDVAAADIAASHAIRRAHRLFVNDSINLACAQRIGLTHLVTHDDDFSSVDTVTVWRPMDI